MKISLNTIKFLNEKFNSSENVSAIGVDKLVEKIGSQLGAVDTVEKIGEKYQGIIVAKVIDCQKHPNADKLSVCVIDDGGVDKNVQRDKDGHIQVVCGAPNIATGQTIAWLPPGSTVPDTFNKEPFVLEARELRGEVSNGMIASPKELALNDNHEGILVLDDSLKAGADFAESLQLKDDVVIDIENKMFTHRPDCFGYLGIARELAGIQSIKYASPSWYATNPNFPSIGSTKLDLKVENELSDLVPRFTMICLSEVKVGPSPAWLQVELAKQGQKSINNIVDYTNYFMIETGQPLHAYDYDKVKALSGGTPTIVVRNPRTGEKVKLLNGKEIDPRQEAIMIATDKQLIGVGGVMGGSETEVDESTQNIILECGNFDMYSIRRTSMAHGLFTEAVTRFNKGQSPLQNLAVLNRITTEIVERGEGTVASEIFDNNHIGDSSVGRGSLRPEIKISADFINLRLGLKLSLDEIQKILANVEFKVEIKDDLLEITAPFWRTDIELREDIVEEVGRLHGYDNLPLDLPIRNLMPAKRDELFDTKAQIRNKLSRAGANEVLTYSFVPNDLLQKVGQDSEKTFQVSNALSPDLEYYRVSLMPSLLDKVHPNIKAGYDEFALFEIGKTHSVDHIDDEGLPIEFEFTGLVVTAADKLKKPGSAYFEARKYLEYLSEAKLEFKPISDSMLVYPVVQPYDVKRSAMVSIKGGDFIGIIGEFKTSVLRSLKLPKYTAGFEIDTQSISASLSSGPSYEPLSKYPSVKQDITLRIDSDKSSSEIYDFVDRELGANAPDDTLLKLQLLDIYRKQDESSNQNTYRITITANNRTLTDKEVNMVLETIAKAAKNSLGAERI